MSDLNFAHYSVMLKKRMLNDTHNAKTAHKRWLRRLNNLVDNLPVDINTLPTDARKTEFGQWFYSNGIKCNQIPKLEYYVTLIDFLYRELHNSYLKIHPLYTSSSTTSKLLKILHPSQRKISTKQLKIAKFYRNDIESLSKELLTFLDEFEKHLAIQPNEELLKLI